MDKVPDGLWEKEDKDGVRYFIRYISYTVVTSSIFILLLIVDIFSFFHSSFYVFQDGIVKWAEFEGPKGTAPAGQDEL